MNYNILHGIFCPLRHGQLPRTGPGRPVPEPARGRKVPAGRRAPRGERAARRVDQGSSSRRVRREVQARDVGDRGQRQGARLLHAAGQGPEGPPAPRRSARMRLVVELQSDLGPVVLVVTHQDGDKTFPACRNDIERYKCPKSCPEGTTFAECQTVLGEEFGDEVGLEEGDPPLHGRLQHPGGDAPVPATCWPRLGRLAPRRRERRSATPPPGCSCTAGRNDVTLDGAAGPDRPRERADRLHLREGAEGLYARNTTPGPTPIATASGRACSRPSPR